MSIYIFSNLLTGLSALAFGFYVLSRNERSRATALFFLFSLSVTVWSLANWWMGILKVMNGVQALILIHLSFLGLILMPVLFLHFIYALIEIKKRFVLSTATGLGVFFVLLNISDFFLNSASSIAFFFGVSDVAWSWNVYSVFMIFWLAANAFIHFELMSAHRKAFGLHKMQIKFLLLAFAPFYVIVAADFLIFFGFSYIALANIFLPFCLSLFVYALLSRRFADLRAVWRRLFVFVVSISFLLIAAFFAFQLLKSLFGNFRLFFEALILVGGVIVFPAIKNFFDGISSRYLFVSSYDDRRLAMAVGEELKGSFDLKKNYLLLYDVLFKAFHFKGFSFFDWREDEDVYGAFYSDGFVFDKKMSFVFDEMVNKDFILPGKLVVAEELRQCCTGTVCDTLKKMIEMELEVIVPLNIGNRQIGFLGLGAKSSNEIYDEDDLRVLEAIAPQLAVAFENALLYKETINFNVRLTEEIEKSTFELREANKELLRLDKAKSEFISIASHQLRTPLTIVKGYVSMIIEGLYGAITPEVKESLQKIDESNQRLIRLVESLLLVSRIESCKLQIVPTDTDITSMLNSVVAEVTGIAGKKKIIFSVDVPRSTVRAMVDKDKMRQVVFSLVDNAVRYSVYGKVKVSLKVVSERFEFSVVDSGIGITAEEKENLFRKFYRGPKAPLMHTEGVGIGLFVAKEIIEAHGGRIWAKSEGEGAGAEFLFYVPLSK